MKILFEIVISMWDVVDNGFVNWIIVGFLGPITYMLSFKFIGDGAHLMGYNSSVMSFSHWVVRIFIYFILSSILKVLFYMINIILSFFRIVESFSWTAILIILF